MYIGLSGFGSGTDTFNINNVVNNFYRIELSNSIFDEISIRERTDIDLYDDTKEAWNYDNLLLCSFVNNIEGGNVALNGINIEYLRLKKRKKEDLVWETLKDIPFDTNIQDYTYIDKMVETLETYEYALQPISAGGVLGNNIISEIDCDFEGVWLCNKDKQYQLFYNLEVGNYDTVLPTNVLETLGGQYPIVQTSGNLKYRRGNLKCMLVSDSTANGSGIIDRKQEKINRQNIMSFLTDRRPKLYKESSGENMLIMIIGTPSLAPENNLSQRIYNLSIEFVEIGGTDTQTLKDNGLI